MNSIDQPSTPSFHDAEDGGVDDFMERMRNLFGSQVTVVDKLRELYEGDNTKAFEEFLDDATYLALEENTDFIENAKKMRESSAHEQTIIRDHQRATFDETKRFILLEADLPTEASFNDVEKARQTIARILRDNLDDTSNSEIDDVLRALGILRADDEGNDRFRYPEEIFPESTNNKWIAYTESVLQYFRIERAVDAGTRGREDLESIDHTRHIAHNSIAHDIDEVLGLSALPDTTWDFEKSRKLVAKMRDMKYPTVETAESASTRNAVGAGLVALHALKALNIKIAELGKQ